MKKRIIAWWQNIVAWWNWKESVASKDAEIVSLRTQVNDLAKKNLKLEDQVNEYRRDIVIMAGNVEQERKAHKDALEIQHVKYVLLERRIRP